MKILFLARHFTYFRNFEGAILLLASRGHDVHLAADRDDQQVIAERLAAASPRITWGMTPELPASRSRQVSAALRLGFDYLRYQEEAYRDATKIRQRASERAPRAAVWLAGRAGTPRAARWLGALEGALPPPPEVTAFLAGQRPDLVLLTPLIELGSPQLDYLRAARAAAIPTALCVWSWDHLSSKALIRVRPDRVLVWNETQKGEAVRLHGVPPDEVVVTGAQCFDRWFDREPSRPREAFCARAGLAQAAPYVLYVCSSLFKGSLPEPTFVRRWLTALRSSDDPAVRDCPVLVRPHPQRMGEWDGIDITREFPGVAFFGAAPVDRDSQADYFDSMYHAAAVVGLNTSALIESAIVDRPVYTVLLPEFEDNQEGTLHFRYLLEVGDGFLHVSRSLQAHVRQLGEGLRGLTGTQNQAFVRAFIRPSGIPATPVFVAAVEAAGALRVRPDERAITIGAGAAAGLLVAAAGTPWGLRWFGDPRWSREAVRKAAAQNERRERYVRKAREHAALVWRRRRARAVAAVKTVLLKLTFAEK